MKINKTLLLLLISFIFNSCDTKKSNPEIAKEKKDSISVWIKKSKQSSLELPKQKQFLLKAYTKLKTQEIDSINLKIWSDIAYQQFKLNDTILFKKINKEALSLATKLKDSFVIGDIHWSYATHYNKKQVYDSAYYHFNTAEKHFVVHGYHKAKMLIGKAYLKTQFSDYIGSEIDLIQALKIFKKLKKHKEIASCYNSLGIIQEKLEEYDLALGYFEKALENEKKAKKKNKFSININIGFTYQKKGEYTTAISYFKKDLTIKLRTKKPIEYARIIDNIAYTNLLNKDTLAVKKDFLESLFIRDSLQNTDGIITSCIHLSEYYLYKKDTVSAKKYILKANSLAENIKNNIDYLSTLKRLAIIDKENADVFLNKYVAFKDSVQIAERKIQNRFTRISFETEQYIAQTEILSEETERLSEEKTWLIILGVIATFASSLFYYFRTQKVKNEKLMLESEQQKANEQVYLLTLHQQTKLEEEKIKDRNRISEELHDGVLGKLFGARIGLGFLDIEANEDVKKQYDSFLNELQTIEKEIRDVSHKLNDNFDSINTNFTTILKELIEKNSKIGGFKYRLNYSEITDWYKINEVIKANLYRIIQESLQNVFKYAKAKNVSIIFSSEENYLLLTIIDDGVGFVIKKNVKGIGLKNIKSRVEKLNGKIDFYTKPNEGTRIEIKIPIK